MTPAEIDGLRRYLRQALAYVLELAGATRSERDHRLYGALVRLEWASTALLDGLEIHSGELERLSSDAIADARTVLATTRALSAVVAAVADSVDRRLVRSGNRMRTASPAPTSRRTGPTIAGCYSGCGD